MNRIIKNTVGLIAVLAVILCIPLTVMAAGGKDTVAAAARSAAVDYLMKEVPDPACASVGGEWTVAGLSGCTGAAQGECFDKYYRNLEATVKKNKGVLSEDYYTEYSRAVIALSAIGKSALDVAGYDLVKPIRDYEKVTEQGLNGAIYALIALDKGGYVGPRREYREYILGKELPGGGWNFMGRGEADPDMTAMAVQALSGYKLFKDVSPAIERSMPILDNTEYDSCESVAQIIIALDALEMKPSDAMKKQLLEFALPDGSFKHSSDEDEGNIMSTEQALMALSVF